MLELLKRFWTEENGGGAIEAVILIGVLVAVALIFREAIIKFVKDLIAKTFNPDAVPGVESGG